MRRRADTARSPYVAFATGRGLLFAAFAMLVLTSSHGEVSAKHLSSDCERTAGFSARSRTEGVVGRTCLLSIRSPDAAAPKISESPHAPPTILITGLRVAGVPREVPEHGEIAIRDLALKADENNIQVDVLGVADAPGTGMSYAYTLTGAGAIQAHVTNSHTIDLAGLSSGSYQFEVRAIEATGRASITPAVINFTIPPPLWRRWWVLAIAALLGGVAAFGWFRVRCSRIVELERVRTRIATDLHDDIGSSLTQIAILSEIARSRACDGDPFTSDILDKIAGTSRELVDAMSDVVWAINPKQDQLSDLVQRMRRFAGDLFDSRDIPYVFAAPHERLDAAMDADVRREVYLIFKESLNNSIKHSGCSSVTIGLRVDAGILTLSVRDDGDGFDPSGPTEGHGLASMRRRAEALGGTLCTTSARGTGTTVTLTVPQMHRKARRWTRELRAMGRRVSTWFKRLPLGAGRVISHVEQGCTRFAGWLAREIYHRSHYRGPARDS